MRQVTVVNTAPKVTLTPLDVGATATVTPNGTANFRWSVIDAGRGDTPKVTFSCGELGQLLWELNNLFECKFTGMGASVVSVTATDGTVGGISSASFTINVAETGSG
jgi:hypothetical protein